MDDDKKDGITVQSQDTASSSIVILVFSEAPKPHADWERLCEELLATLQGWADIGERMLDGIAGQIGRVLEIHAYNRGNAKPISLASCTLLRQSSEVERFERANNVEVVIQPLDLYNVHKTPGLAVFDMDSTLIQQEVIDELARSVGRYDQVAAVTEAAMRGELNFEESLQARVAQLDGVSTDIWDYMKANVITFTPGAADLIRALKGLGWKTAVLSGGFTPLAYWVKDVLGLDYAYANELETTADRSKLTGKLLSNAPIVGPELKRETLLKLASENEISIMHTIAVGDGSNDLPMMHAAGFGIAFNAKPKVQVAAPARLNSKSLLDVLYVLGYSGDEVAQALR